MRLKSFSYFLVCPALLAGCTVSRAAHGAESSVDLSVETGSPDALCPDLAATRQAVRDRLGQLTLDGEKRWVARYTIGHAPGGGGDYVELVLKDGGGALRLSRRLPLGGEACDTVVQAIALVLERYFRELQAPASAPEPEPEPAPQPALELTRALTLVPEREKNAQNAGPAAPPLAPSLQVAAEAGFALGPKTGVVGLELGLWFAHSFEASLEPQLLLPEVVETIHDEQGAERGQAELLEVPLRASIGLGQRHGRLAYHVGPQLRVSLRRASTQRLVVAQPRPQSGDASAVGWAVAIGGLAGASWWLSPSFGLTASLALDAKLAETRFAVAAGATSNQSLLASPSLQAQMLLGVAFGASP